MRNQILAAAIAALSFTACSEKKSPPPLPRVEAQTPSRAEEVGFDVSSKSPIAEPLPPRPAPAIDDGLAMAHSQHGRVDHVSRARELKETGDFFGAITEARRAVADDPKDGDALRIITRVGKVLGQHETVAAAWGRLAELSPADPSPLIQQARELVAVHDEEGAVKLCRLALERDPSAAEAFHTMGRAYLAAGSLQDAIDNFHRAIELAPDHGYALNNLGFAYLRANQNEQAELVLEQAARVLPGVGYVQNNLGVALERLGRKDEAQAAYQRAMDVSPKYVKAKINSARMSRVARASPDEVPDDAQPMPDATMDSDIPQD